MRYEDSDIRSLGGGGGEIRLSNSSKLVIDMLCTF